MLLRVALPLLLLPSAAPFTAMAPGGLRPHVSRHACAPTAPVVMLAKKKGGKPKSAKGGKPKAAQPKKQEKASVREQRFTEQTKSFIFTILGLNKVLPDGSGAGKDWIQAQGINKAFYTMAQQGQQPWAQVCQQGGGSGSGRGRGHGRGRGRGRGG